MSTSTYIPKIGDLVKVKDKDQLAKYYHSFSLEMREKLVCNKVFRVTGLGILDGRKIVYGLGSIYYIYDTDVEPVEEDDLDIDESLADFLDDVSKEER